MATAASPVLRERLVLSSSGDHDEGFFFFFFFFFCGIGTPILGALQSLPDPPPPFPLPEPVAGVAGPDPIRYVGVSAAGDEAVRDRVFSDIAFPASRRRLWDASPVGVSVFLHAESHIPVLGPLPLILFAVCLHTFVCCISLPPPPLSSVPPLYWPVWVVPLWLM